MRHYNCGINTFTRNGNILILGYAEKCRCLYFTENLPEVSDVSDLRHNRKNDQMRIYQTNQLLTNLNIPVETNSLYVVYM